MFNCVFLMFSFRQQGEETEVDINEGTVKWDLKKRKNKGEEKKTVSIFIDILDFSIFIDILDFSIFIDILDFSTFIDICSSLSAEEWGVLVVILVVIFVVVVGVFVSLSLGCIFIFTHIFLQSSKMVQSFI